MNRNRVVFFAVALVAFVVLLLRGWLAGTGKPAGGGQTGGQGPAQAAMRPAPAVGGVARPEPAMPLPEPGPGKPWKTVHGMPVPPEMPPTQAVAAPGQAGQPAIKGPVPPGWDPNAPGANLPPWEREPPPPIPEEWKRAAEKAAAPARP